ncbi:MAG TPA: DUF4058 family protein [Pirellulales bacterium]|nr:DUF4058 family protein [Pirellulales bacterium]
MANQPLSQDLSPIFPGMDPYLENPHFWTGFHARFIVYISDHLQTLLPPRYVAAVEERVYVEGPRREVTPDVSVRRSSGVLVGAAAAVLDVDEPTIVEVSDVEVHESYVAILDLETGQSVVTVIEVLSPANKYLGDGQDLYLRKQQEVLGSTTHLIEIDLLRGGHHVLAVPEREARGRHSYDFLVSVNRAQGKRNRFELYAPRLRDRLPRVWVPLAGADLDVRLDLQAVLAQTYHASRYRGRLPYDGTCQPRLNPDDQDWARQLIEKARMTGGLAQSSERPLEPPS